MKVGYACVNTSINCSTSKTFRLKNYSRERLMKTVSNNLSCLKRVLKFNQEHAISFYRITSKLVPFASHSINNVDWLSEFKEELEGIGELIKNNSMRVSMHPDP